jgi:hypothetical protein
MKTLNEFINEIDMSELREQKKVLYELADHFESKREYNVFNALDGIIHLLDSLQDYAVDEMGMDEKNVFLMSEE